MQESPPKPISEQRDCDRFRDRDYDRIKQFATRVGVCKNTVLNWMRRGMPVTRVGRVVRIPVAEACKWLQEGPAQETWVTEGHLGAKAPRPTADARPAEQITLQATRVPRASRVPTRKGDRTS